MKSIYKEGQGYQRGSDEIAEKKVTTGGFKYVSKTEWKESLKTPEPEIHGVVIDGDKIKLKKQKKLEKHKKLGEKQYE